MFQYRSREIKNGFKQKLPETMHDRNDERRKTLSFYQSIFIAIVQKIEKTLSKPMFMKKKSSIIFSIGNH